MRSAAQLTAGARRAATRAPSDLPRADDRSLSRPSVTTQDGPGARPVAPPGASREGLVRLVEAVAARLGLTDTDLRALRLVVGACRWADFEDPARDPVCFRQQQRLAGEMGITPGHFRRIERKLERAGLIERRTTDNGHRGRLAPAGPDGVRAPVAGLSVAPLLAALPQLEALAEAVAREVAALLEGRAMIRIERRAARHAAYALPPGHPARAAYEALRGAGFLPSAGYRDGTAIASHLEALRGVIAQARAAADETGAEREEAPVGTECDGQDGAFVHGAACVEERRHTEDPTDPHTGSWSAATGGEGAPGGQTSGAGRAEAEGREDEELAEAEHRMGSGNTRAGQAGWTGETETPSRDAGEDEGIDNDARSRATCLPPGVAARLTPALLRELGSEEMQLYVDHLDPHAGPPTLRDVERAALMRRRELGLSPALWEEIEAAMGWLDALVALVVVDANRRHPTAPVRNPAGLLRDLARRRRAGALDLGASVMGLWRRRAEE